MPNARGYELNFGGVSSTTFPWFGVERVRRRMFGANRDVLREVGGREGAWRFGEKKGLRLMEVECFTLSGSFPVERREDIVAVADWLDQGFQKLIVGDEPDRYYMATLASEIEIDEWRNLGRFTLEFLTDPYAYSTSISNETLTLTDGVEDTFAIDDTVVGYPVVEITPVGGNLVGFTLNFNGYEMVYEGTLASPNTLTISSIAYVTLSGTNTDTELTGDFDPTGVDMQDVSGAFPALIPSQPQSVTLDFGVGSTASSATVEVSWRRRYR